MRVKESRESRRREDVMHLSVCEVGPIDLAQGRPLSWCVVRVLDAVAMAGSWGSWSPSRNGLVGGGGGGGVCFGIVSPPRLTEVVVHVMPSHSKARDRE